MYNFGEERRAVEFELFVSQEKTTSKIIGGDQAQTQAGSGMGPPPQPVSLNVKSMKHKPPLRNCVHAGNARCARTLLNKCGPVDCDRDIYQSSIIV